jgi:hypothetical protein
MVSSSSCPVQTVSLRTPRLGVLEQVLLLESFLGLLHGECIDENYAKMMC